MTCSMRNATQNRPFVFPRMELVLRLGDGTPWRLTMSAGCERFVGFYPRIDGIEADDAVLSYRAVGRVER